MPKVEYVFCWDIYVLNMATRDRSLEYQRMRAVSVRTAPVPTTIVKPQYEKNYEEISGILLNISRLLTTYKSQICQHQRVCWNPASKDAIDSTARVMTTKSTITEQLRIASQKILQFRNGTETAVPETRVIVANMQTSLSKKAMAIDGAFRRLTREYTELTKTSEPDVFATATATATAPILQNSQEEIDTRYLEIEHAERADGIVRIAKDSSELAKMSDHMRMVVLSQGEMIDRIETNVTSAESNVGKGTVQLESADKSQESANKCCLWAAIVIAAIILCLIIAIAIRFSK